MTPSQARVKVAEAMGYTGWKLKWSLTQLPELVQCNLQEATCVSLNGAMHSVEGDYPNYPASLDACLSFEETLTRDEVTLYITELRSFPAKVNWEGCMGHGATPLQRCLAYLRTKGLSTDDKEGMK